MSMPPPYDPNKVYNLTPDEDLSQLPDPPTGWPGTTAPPTPPPPPTPPTWGYQPPSAPPPPTPSGRSRTGLAVGLSVVGILIGQATSKDDDTAAPSVANETTTTYTPPTTEYRTTTTTDAYTDRELQELALDMTWDETSSLDRKLICEGVEEFGVGYAAEIANGAGGAEGAFDQDLLEAKFAEWCQTY
jgi:hypothetical protein